MTKTIRFETFGIEERNQLAGALRVAIDVYRNDASNCGSIEGHERIAADFKRSVEYCQRLLDELENA